MRAVFGASAHGSMRLVVVTPRSDVSWRAHDATEGRCDRAGRVIGVIVIVRPVTGVANPGQLIALAAAVGFGISIAVVKSLTGTELTLAIIFWMLVVQSTAGFLCRRN